jgi:hypothetical protein
VTEGLFALELSCCDCVEIKVSIGNVPFPHWDSHISVALMAQYLNVCQRKLGTSITQTVHILQHAADTASLPVEDFVKHNPSFSKIIQPGRRTVTPQYQCSYLLTYDLYGPIHNFFDVGKSIMRPGGRGLGPGNQDFFGPVKWHQAIRRVPFGGRKSRDYQGPTPSHLPK